MPVRIEIVSDVVCPWCFIGKRRLEQALARTPHATEVAWLPFQLNPDLPEAGVDRAEYVQRKFGAAAREVYGRVTAAGAGVGIPFAFDRIARQPNTLAAHQLIALAAPGPAQDRLVEALFTAYFLQGVDLTARDNLLDLAQSAGLDRAAAQACLDDAGARRAVEQETWRSRALGVEGVPFFIFDRRLAVSGAHAPEVLLGAIEQAASGAHDDRQVAPSS
jgi:predicted DsbA family dithiol-disulfide isomerase